jgi:hypothetical protein
MGYEQSAVSLAAEEKWLGRRRGALECEGFESTGVIRSRAASDSGIADLGHLFHLGAVGPYRLNPRQCCHPIRFFLSFPF